LKAVAAGRWNLDTSELSSAVKFNGGDGRLAASALQPNQVQAPFAPSLSQAQP